jgi:Nuclease-related domain
MDSPGASARNEYERRRRARERATRERHPWIGGLLIALGEAPAHERAWLRGAEGEERAAARLARLLSGTGVVLLHDRRIPGSRANIDHLAVGPGGVTVIDTKRLAGKVEVRGRGDRAELRVGRRDRSKLLDGVARQAAAVSRAVDGVDVRAALCFVEPSGLPLLGRLRVRGIVIDGPRVVARLARRPGTLDRTAIDQLAAALDRGFPRSPGSA